MSLPSWGRGLKPYYLEDHYCRYLVAPLVGAWIETLMILINIMYRPVAPLVGAWIETSI